MTVVAIDFGTSNTIVCIEDPLTQAPRTLAFDSISRRFYVGSDPVDVVPTLVFIQATDQILLGEAVRAQRLGAVQPERLFQSFKRDLVADYVPPPRIIDDHSYGPEQVAEIFLRHIDQAITQANIQPSQVIFTVPVGSFERYLTWIRTVGQQLSFPSIRIIDESTAAALGYAVTHPGSIVLVVDFGGGTLDLSLVRTAAQDAGQTVFKAEVIAKTDAYVGGIDIDTWIVEAYLAKQGSSKAEIGPIGWQNLIEIAERMKIRLSQEEKASESWFDDERFMAYELECSRLELEDILESRQLLDQVRSALDEILLIAQSKGIAKSQIEQVLLVGGSCQIPAIQQLVISYFGRARVQADKPFEAVAHGALLLGKQVEVEDYLRHNYAIRLWDPHAKAYTYFPLFEKGCRYPCQRSEALTLQVANDGQQEVRLDLGEIADVAQAEVAYDAQGRMTSRRLTRQTDFRPLSDRKDPVCLARLNPPGKVGTDRIRIEFEVNDQRILIASVEDLWTQQVLVSQQPVAKLD